MPALDAEALLGARIRELRRSAGWTQAALTRLVNEHAGFSWCQTTVSKIEAADRAIRVNEAAAIAAVFGIPLAKLLNGRISPSAGTGLRQQRERERELRLQAERATREQIAAEILAKIR